jgi:hypothetical protein
MGFDALWRDQKNNPATGEAKRKQVCIRARALTVPYGAFRKRGFSLKKNTIEPLF